MPRLQVIQYREKEEGTKPIVDRLKRHARNLSGTAPDLVGDVKYAVPFKTRSGDDEGLDKSLRQEWRSFVTEALPDCTEPAVLDLGKGKSPFEDGSQLTKEAADVILARVARECRAVLLDGQGLAIVHLRPGDFMFDQGKHHGRPIAGTQGDIKSAIEDLAAKMGMTEEVTFSIIDRPARR